MSTAMFLAMAGAASAPMTFAGTLPAGTVGVAYSAAMTLGGTFTGPVTIDASSGSIPAWMTPTVSGTTVTFAGTPTTNTTYSFTPRATDSTTPTAQVANGPAQSVVVSAAGAGPTLIQQAASANQSTTSSTTVTLASAPTVGNVLLMAVRANTSTEILTMPDGWTVLATALPSGSAKPIVYYTKTSDGTETSVTCAFNGPANHGMGYQEWSAGATFGTPTGLYVATTTNPLVCGPTSSPPNSSSIPSMFMFFNNLGTSRTITWPAGWTYTPATSSPGQCTTVCGALNTAPNAAVSPSISFSSAPANYMYWMCVWVN